MERYGMTEEAWRVRRRKPCVICGAPKESRQGAKYCLRCRERRDRELREGLASRQRLCPVCKERMCRRRNRSCDVCREATYQGRHALAPCASCGGPKEPGRKGAWYCLECTEFLREVRDAHERARATRKRKPCISCGRAKPPGLRGSRLCPTCKSERATRTCERCHQRPPRDPGKKLCFACYEDSAKRRKARSFSRWYQWSPEQKAKHTAANELRRRLRRETRAQEAALAKRRSAKGGHLPVAPFRAWLMAYQEETGLSPGEFCDLLEINDRQFRRWRHGSSWIYFDDADRVLMVAGGPTLTELYPDHFTRKTNVA